MERETVAAVAAIGAVIGLAQYISTDEKLTWRHALGRAVVTAGLSVSAFSVLAWLPNVPEEGVVGLACLIASLGTDWLRVMVNKWTDKHGSK